MLSAGNHCLLVPGTQQRNQWTKKGACINVEGQLGEGCLIDVSVYNQYNKEEKPSRILQDREKSWQDKRVRW